MIGQIKELQDPMLRAHYFAFVFKNTHRNIEHTVFNCLFSLYF